MSYVALDWPVLPLRPRDKIPATAHGLHDASADPEQIERWWAQNPTFNIGLRTGIAFDVLDLDGPAALASLEQIAPGYKHPGPVASTGKGFHLLFAVTGSRNGAALRPGIDWRGDGGYIVAAPSIHPSGSIYTWLKPVSLVLPAAPGWLVDLLAYRQPPKEYTPPTGTVRQALGMLSTAEELARMGAPLRRIANRLVTRCPLGTHRDTTPSFNVYPDDSFFCFGCQAWGDALNLVNFQRTGQLR